jgi:uroporphyrinogen-III synthase
LSVASSGGNAAPSFDGLTVLSFEARRAHELASLISTYGGRPLLAPALREVPLDSNVEALAFAERLLQDEFDVTIFLTGVGTRLLVASIEPRYSRTAVVTALSRTKVVARGPKPVAALRELQVPIWLIVPEPNTWRDLVDALDRKRDERPLDGARVAVQEYGVSNDDLLAALRERGAHVTRVPVYQWALPEDLGPLRTSIQQIADGRVDVLMFTTSVQVVHLWQIVQEMGLEATVRERLRESVVASIGPSTSQELRQHGLSPDLEPSHPKIGFLVRETAQRAAGLLREKRRSVDQR